MKTAVVGNAKPQKKSFAQDRSFLGNFNRTNNNRKQAQMERFTRLHSFANWHNLQSNCLVVRFWCRPLPANEIRAVASFLGSLLSCDIDSWPTETLAHRYWTKFGSDHAATADYVQCLRMRNLTTNPACHEFATPHCGRRFGEKPPSRTDECNRLLWSDKFRARHPSEEVRTAFGQYRTCMARLRKQVNDDVSSCAFVASCNPKILRDCDEDALPNDDYVQY